MYHVEFHDQLTSNTCRRQLTLKCTIHVRQIEYVGSEAMKLLDLMVSYAKEGMIDIAGNYNRCMYVCASR